MNGPEPVRSLEDRTGTFGTRRGPARAVAGGSLAVARGETLALVGEAGSGKSMSLLDAPGLTPRSARVSGQVRLLGEDLLADTEAGRRRRRGRPIGFVFQDPMPSLNPVLPVGRQVREA